MYGPLIAALNRAMPGTWQHDLIDFPTQDSLKGIHSLQSLSEKTLEHCIRPLQKDRTSRTVYYDTVVGVSMGGMMAQILVGQNLIRADNLILISTAYRGSDVRQPFLSTAWAPALLPGFLRSPVQWVIGKSYPLFRRNVAEAREFARMFLDFPRKIFFDAPSWIKRWPGEPGLQATLAMKPLPSDSQSLRVFRIHGTSDPLLSYKKIQRRIHLDQVFEKGSHIVFATEASAIAKSMKAFLTSGESSDLSSYLDQIPSTPRKSRSSGPKKKNRSRNEGAGRKDTDGRNAGSGKGRNSRKRRKKPADVGQ
tara:strand:+ start:14620 stop:15543 length:924 start_codon:yes stop_codon:yes gene_type:complete